MGYGYDVPDHGTEYAVSLLGKVRRFQKEKVAEALMNTNPLPCVKMQILAETSWKKYYEKRKDVCYYG